MDDIAKDLRRFAVEVATELSDETAAITVAVLTVAADEIERLRAARDACEAQYQQQVALTLQHMERADRLQSLIDEFSNAHASMNGLRIVAVADALLAAATPKENDR